MKACSGGLSASASLSRIWIIWQGCYLLNSHVSKLFGDWWKQLQAMTVNLAPMGSPTSIAATTARSRNNMYSSSELEGPADNWRDKFKRHCKSKR